MYRPEWRRRLQEVVQRFREKGAISPEKAMSVTELGLPAQFEHVFERRLSRLGVFVKVDGKYDLSESRLEEIRGRRYGAKGEVRDWRRKMLLLRVLRIGIGILLLCLFLVNLYVQSSDVRIASTVGLLTLVAISIVQVYYLTRTLRRRPVENSGSSTGTGY